MQARKVGLSKQLLLIHLLTLVVQLNVWTMGFIISPFLSPFMMGFIVAHARYILRPLWLLGS